jgi:hypothetical protein
MNQSNGATLQSVFASHLPIGYCIIQYLAPIDYISLSLSFAAIRRRYPTTTDFLFNRIRCALMKRLGDEMGDTFAKYLYPNHLTGGFLLAVLNGDEIRPEQDIDVIMKADDVTLYSVLSPWLDYDVETIYSECYRQDEQLRITTCVTLETKCRIQFIYYREWKEHIDGYDLDFCKNVANSNHFYVTHFAAVLRRRCVFSVLQYVLRYVEFDRCDDSWYMAFSEKQERCKKLFTDVQNRIQKYRLRGYEIMITDNSARDIEMSLSWPEMVLPEHLFVADLWSELK